MLDLSTDYLGLRLRSPIVASASPLTGDLDALSALDDAGVGAVVLPSLFEEQIVNDSEQVAGLFSPEAEGFGEAQTFFPDLSDYNTGPGSYLDLVRDARRRLSVPLIASLNGTTTSGWVSYARSIEEAGADALELNIYLIPVDFTLTAAEVERRYLDLVAAVRGRVSIPLAVKVGPFFNALPSMATGLVEAGADGLVLFNRFYQPDIDIESREVSPRLVLSTSDELLLPLRWIAVLAGRVDGSLALSTGVHTAEDAVKGLLAGADVVMTTSALLRHGPGHVRVLEQGLREWMAEGEYSSVRQLKGSVSQRHSPDPEAYARANYIQIITSFSSPAPG